MSLLQRSLDPEKTLGLVDVLYTAVLDLSRWRAGRSVSSPVPCRALYSGPHLGTAGPSTASCVLTSLIVSQEGKRANFFVT